MANSFDSELLPQRIRKAVEDRIGASIYQTLVIGLVIGKRSEIYAFGKLDDGRPPDGDTVYEIASLTKTFTATLLAEAVLSGRLGLDTPVGSLLRDFKIPERKAKRISLEDTATHFSGLPRIPSNLKPKDRANPFADYDIDRFKVFLADYELPRDPGESYEYSNLNTGLLGLALARSAETTYDSLLAEQILRPFGMSMSGTTCSDAMLARLAPGHDRTGNPAKSWDYGALAGAGAIRSTVNDMLRYLEANMGVRQTHLSDAMKLAQQERRQKNENLRIGLAWFSTHGIVVHGGEPGGYKSYLGFRRDGSKGVVILTNTAAEVYDLGNAVLFDDAPFLAIQKPLRLTIPSLQEYVGLYSVDENLWLKIFRVDYQLYARMSGQTAFEIFASAPDEFFTDVAGNGLRFSRNDGAVSALTLHQGAAHTSYSRQV